MFASNAYNNIMLITTGRHIETHNMTQNNIFVDTCIIL